MVPAIPACCGLSAFEYDLLGRAKEDSDLATDGHGYTRMRSAGFLALDREKIGTKLYGYVLAKRYTSRLSRSTSTQMQAHNSSGDPLVGHIAKAGLAHLTGEVLGGWELPHGLREIGIGVLRSGQGSP